MEHSLHLLAKHFVQAVSSSQKINDGCDDSGHGEDDGNMTDFDAGDSLSKALALVSQVCVHQLQRQ